MTKLKLKEPIKQGEELITELEFKIPHAKDMRGMSLEPKFSDILDLAGRLCGHPPSVIDQLSAPDAMEVAAIVGNFITNGRGTGEQE